LKKNLIYLGILTIEVLVCVYIYILPAMILLLFIKRSNILASSFI